VDEKRKGICEIARRRPKTHIIQKGRERTEVKVKSNAEQCIKGLASLT